MSGASDYRCLWDLACDALIGADAIVFLGFRFPETDAHPREVLLDAVRKNKASSGNGGPVSIHIVLGPPGFDTDRLEALINFTGPRCLTVGGDLVDRFSVEVHPLFGQDFLAVVRRERLFR